MTEPVSSPAYAVAWLPEAWFWLLFGVLAIYVVLDGFDFGVGLIYGTRESERERETLHAAFGPIWKANEVWLVLFVTVLFAAFPSVYANLLSRHYLLIFLLLLGVILRGIGVKLREERESDRWERYCDYAFVAGSIISPVVLGVFVVQWVFGAVPLVVAVAGGVTLLGLCFVLGATFLAVKTTDPLRAEMVTYATGATPVYALCFAATGSVLYAVGSAALEVVALAAAATAVCSLGVVASARLDADRGAFGSAAGLAVVFVGFLAVALYPMIDPAAGLSIADAVVAPLTLHITTIMAAIFLPIVGAGFVVLYSVFEGVADPEDGY